MQSTMMDFPLTLAHVFERAGRLFGAAEIVSRLPDKSLHRHHYRDFFRRANALGGALQAAGLKPGDRVATLMWNHYAHLEAYFGIPCAGGVLHTLNLRLHPDDIAYIANHAGDRFLIVDDVLLPLGELARLLTIGITVDPQARSATGFLLTEDRTFALDAAGGSLTVGRTQQSFDAARVQWIDDELYVPSRLLQQWLPVDVKVDLNQLAVEVQPQPARQPLRVHHDGTQRRQPLAFRNPTGLRLDQVQVTDLQWFLV